MIDNMDMGLAVLCAGPARKEFQIMWSNNSFETLFECKNSVDSLTYRIFRDYGDVVDAVHKDWSVCELMHEVHKKFLSAPAN